MLRITIPNGTLVVSKETAIPLTITNPMFSDRGSGSLPFSVPDCEHNQKVLGYPNRITRSGQNDTSYAVTVETDIKTLKGTLKYVDTSDGKISLNFYYNEGDFWYWAKNTKLRTITTLANKEIDFVNERENYFNNIWPAVEMAFFPIAVNLVALDNYIPSGGNDNQWSSRKLCISDYIITNNPSDLFRDDYADFLNGGDVSGYITGFLYVNEVLQWIAKTYGLKINANFLASTDELKSSVVLNNATFSNLYTGGYQSVNYSYLLPDVTVLDFLDAVEKKFGCLLFVDSPKKEINIKSIKSIFSEIYSKVARCTVKLNKHTDALGIALKSARSSSPYIAINENYVNNFFFNYFDTEAISRVDGKVYVTAASPDYTNYPNKIVLCTSTQCYFRLEWVDAGDDYEYTATAIHSNYYDISNNEDLDQKKVECDGEFTPMIPVICRQFYNYPDNDFFDMSLTVPHFEKWDNLLELLTGEEMDTPITFAFYRGRIEHVDFPEELFGITEFDLPVGTVDVYDKSGNVITGATLGMRWAGDNGIYEACYKELEQFYLKSAKEVSVSNIKPQDFIDDNIFDVYQNQENVNFIFKEIKITIDPFSVRFDSAIGLTVKPYHTDMPIS